LKINKLKISISIIACIIFSLFPFLTKTKDETFNTTLSTSFAIFSTLISITILIVAVVLFDRFGINAKFKERQVDTVLDLVSEIKTIKLNPSSKIRYVNYIRKCNELQRQLPAFYEADKTKTLLFPNNFSELIAPVFTFYDNPWLPVDIKQKLEFLNIIVTYDFEDFTNDDYIKLDINNAATTPWQVTIPKFSFEMFSINLATLLSTITNWLNDHSTININFDIMERC
jgi:hypothetical protein